MFRNTGPKDKSFLKRSNNICFSLLFSFLLQAFRGHATGDENRPPPRATWGFQLPPSHFLPQSEHQRKWPQSGGVSGGKLWRPQSLGDPSQRCLASWPARRCRSARGAPGKDGPVPASPPGDRSALPPQNPGRPEPRGASLGPTFPSRSGRDPEQKCELCPEIRLVGRA